MNTTESFLELKESGWDIMIGKYYCGHLQRLTIDNILYQVTSDNQIENFDFLVNYLNEDGRWQNDSFYFKGKEQAMTAIFKMKEHFDIVKSTRKGDKH